MKQERTAEAQRAWEREQQRLNGVTEQLKQRLGELELVTGSVRDEVQRMRANFWEEVTVDFSTIDDAIESHASMKQHAETLAERERRYGHAFAEANRIGRLIRSPYFGRIDVREQGEEGEEAVYVGIAGFADKEGERYLIYDWRAPICSLYYDYVPGPCVYETPGGRMAAEMTLKRQFVIRDGTVELMFDTGLTIGDELLQAVLGRTSDLQMKSIVATIQREQNRIIRNDHARMLVVQGAAGSGKTSAALQRAAYLLYKYRDQLHADQLLLFSPNPLFSSYVASVLPELGEENMRQTTFQAYLQHRLGNEFRLEDSFEQLEWLLADGEADWDALRSQAVGQSGLWLTDAEGWLPGAEWWWMEAEQAGEAGSEGCADGEIGKGSGTDEAETGTDAATDGEDEDGRDCVTDGEDKDDRDRATDGEDEDDRDCATDGEDEDGRDCATDGEDEDGRDCATDGEDEDGGEAEFVRMEGNAANRPTVVSAKRAEMSEQVVRLAGIGFKSSIAFVELIRAYAKLLEKSFMRFRPLKLGETVLVSAAQMEERFYSFDSGIRLPNRVELLREWLLEQLAEREEAELSAAWVEDEVELLDADDYRRAYSELRKTGGGFDYYEQEQRLLARYVVRRRMQPLREAVKQLAFADIRSLYVQLFADAAVQRELLLAVCATGADGAGATAEGVVRGTDGTGAEAEGVRAGADGAGRTVEGVARGMDGAGAEVEGVRTGTDGAEAEVVTRGTDEADVTAEGVRAGTDGDTAALWPEKWPEVCHQTLERLADGQLAYEDAAPYLLLRELVLGFTTSPAVRHVFIDEAQDYSAFQLELLKRLFPRCRMTALGDTNQAIYAHATALETNSAEGYAALYGPEQTEVIRLQRSYRSTREIVLFTRGMIPEGHAIEPFTRAGAKPRVTRAADRESLHRRLAERAAELMAGGCATVAILCKTAGESDYAAAELRSRLPGLRLITRHSPSMEPGVLVLPSYLAKGVEFDAVLVYDGSERRYARERDRKLLYTVCTRAMHELHVFTLGEPSPFIGEQPEETYELDR